MTTPALEGSLRTMSWTEGEASRFYSRFQGVTAVVTMAKGHTEASPGQRRLKRAPEGGGEGLSRSLTRTQEEARTTRPSGDSARAEHTPRHGRGAALCTREERFSTAGRAGGPGSRRRVRSRAVPWSHLHSRTVSLEKGQREPKLRAPLSPNP